MGLQSFERRLERMVEGAFSRVFRTGLRPVELGRRLARAMDSQRTIDVRGRTVVPNQFAIALSEDDTLASRAYPTRSPASFPTRHANTHATRVMRSWAR